MTAKAQIVTLFESLSADEKFEVLTSLEELAGGEKSTGKKTGKGSRGGKAKKEVGEPKGAKNAWMFFSGERRKELKEADPSLTFGQLAKLLSEEWKGMDENAREPYQDLADEDKVRATREKEAFAAKK